MKKIFRNIVLICCFVTLLCCFACGKTPDFREVNWGMSIEEVKNKETLSFIDEMELENNIVVLNYKGCKIYDENVELYYYFKTEEKILYKAMCVFEESIASEKAEDIIFSFINDYWEKCSFVTLNGKFYAPDKKETVKEIIKTLDWSTGHKFLMSTDSSFILLEFNLNSTNDFDVNIHYESIDLTT